MANAAYLVTKGLGDYADPIDVKYLLTGGLSLTVTVGLTLALFPVR